MSCGKVLLALYMPYLWLFSVLYRGHHMFSCIIHPFSQSKLSGSLIKWTAAQPSDDVF